MDPDELEQFLRDVVSENAPVDDETEKSAENGARVLGAYYQKFMLYGFSEDRAFQLTMFILNKILDGQKK